MMLGDCSLTLFFKGVTVSKRRNNDDGVVYCRLS